MVTSIRNTELNQQEPLMKKLIIAAAALAALSTASFADQNTENMNMMDAMRKERFSMMEQMMNDQMASLKMQEAMLTSYQRILKQMMENELNSR